MELDIIYDFFLNNKVVLFTTAITLITVVSFLWRNCFNYSASQFPVSLDNQSVEVKPGIRGSHFARDDQLIECIFDDVTTTHEAFLRGMRISKNGKCLGTKSELSNEYTWISYQQVIDLSKNFGSALVFHGLKPVDTTYVGIYSQNCPEWIIAAQACAMFSMVTVPLYDTLGADACQYIINQTKIKLAICFNWSKAKFLLDGASLIPGLKVIIVIKTEDPQAQSNFKSGNIEPNSNSEKSQSESKSKINLSETNQNSLSICSKDVIELGCKSGINVISFQEMLKIGEDNPKELVPAKPETVNTISYTSGTTGNPKGVILTHKAMIANASALIAHDNKAVDICHKDVYFSYLPLAHMFERLNQVMIICFGVKIGFSSGDIKNLMEDLAALKPTLFPTVPRLLNRIYDKTMQSVSGSIIKKTLLNLAINRKLALLKRGIITNNTIWDKLFFKKIQTSLGGRIRACVTGSAPLSSPVLNFTRATFGCYVFEGYGQTEVGAASTLSLANEYETGIVGPPLPNSHIKLIDIPEMDYYSKDNKGEICIKSTSNMSGYFQDPEKTRETIDDDGYVHTGDVGQWTSNGCLKVIDRRKNIFKLAQGEYLAPEKIEDVYLMSPFVAQIYVDGDSLEVYPLGIVVPNRDYLQKWAKRHLNIDCSLDDLCKNKNIKMEILSDLTKRGKEGGLKGFEMVKDVFLHSQLFSMENGLLTPTFKSKRSALRKKFTKEFEEIYKALNAKI